MVSGLSGTSILDQLLNLQKPQPISAGPAGYNNYLASITGGPILPGGPALPTSNPTPAPSGGGGGGGNLSVREQMERGLIPWDDNLLNAPDNGANLAQQAYDNRIRQIQNLFDQTKQQANDIRGQADTTFNDLLEAVGAFRDRASTLKTNAGQEIVNRGADILGSNARTGQEQEGQLRAKGRALGLGDSSKFLNQTGLAQRLAATQGNTIAARGEQDRANNDVFQGRQDQADVQENEAGRYKTSLYDEARRLENTGLSQFGDNTDAASNALGTSLNNILNYQRQLAALQPVQAGGLTAPELPAYSTGTSLASGVGFPVTGTAPTGGAEPGSLYSPTDFNSLLKKIPRNFYTA